MKKLIYLGLFTALMGVVYSSCEKVKESKVDSDVQGNTLSLEKKSEIDTIGVISENLQALNKYLKDKDIETSGAFLSYWSEHPESTLGDLESSGFIDKQFIIDIFNKIESVAIDVDDDVLWRLITKNMDSRFYSLSSDKIWGITLFSCTGCMDGIKKNACYSSIIWSWGPGC